MLGDTDVAYNHYMDRRIIAGILIALVAAGAVTGYLIYPRTPASTTIVPASSITDLTHDRANLIVHGVNLGSVEVWTVPTGTGVSPSDYRLIGKALVATTSASGVETWTLPIPAQSLSVSEIFAKGYDPKGNLIGRVSLKETGATAIYNALWGTPIAVSAPTGSDFTIGVGQKGSFGSLTITLNSITQDNRCPADAVCIVAGSVTTNITIEANGKKLRRTISSVGDPTIWNGYEISVTNVAPNRMAHQQIAASKYQVTFHVDYATVPKG